MEAIEIVRIRLDYADLVRNFAPEHCAPEHCAQERCAQEEEDEETADRYPAQNLCLYLLNYIGDMAAAVRRRWRIRLIGGKRRPAAALFGHDLHRPLVAVRVYPPANRRRHTAARAHLQTDLPLDVEIERDLAFPHSLAAIVGYLRARVPRLQVVIPIHTVDTAPSRSANGAPLSSGEATAPEKPRATSPKTPTRGQERRGKGAPLLACNQWLERELARLVHEDQINALYNPWLARYIALRGFRPQDPRRSFRAAVAGAQKRLAKST